MVKTLVLLNVITQPTPVPAHALEPIGDDPEGVENHTNFDGRNWAFALLRSRLCQIMGVLGYLMKMRLFSIIFAKPIMTTTGSNNHSNP